jgi:glutamate synthase domain-containing protein 2
MSSLSDLTQFAKENNTPIIIHDSNQNENFIFLSLYKFKRMKKDSERKFEENLDQISKKDILNNINRYISIWRKKQEVENKEKSITAIKDQAKIEEERQGQESGGPTSLSPQQLEKNQELEVEEEVAQEISSESNFEQTKNLTKIAEMQAKQQQNKTEDKINKEYEQDQQRQDFQHKDQHDKQKDIPKKTNMEEREVEIENLDQESELDDNLNSSAISYEELDDDLK